jgi:hypothetical protein
MILKKELVNIKKLEYNSHPIRLKTLPDKSKFFFIKLFYNCFIYIILNFIFMNNIIRVLLKKIISFLDKIIKHCLNKYRYNKLLPLSMFKKNKNFL